MTATAIPTAATASRTAGRAIRTAVTRTAASWTAGGGLPELPVGGGGDCGGWLRKIKIAISTASAASSSISSQETRMVRQPARSYRPGQGSGQSRASPGRTRSTQYCW